jgi:iron(III) transport system permease protein
MTSVSSESPVERTASGARFSLPVGAIASLALTLTLLFVVFYPLFGIAKIALWQNGFFSVKPLFDVVRESWFLPAFQNTAVVVIGSSASALLIGGLLAWVNERTDASLGAIGEILPLLPLLVPGVALASGWAFLGAPKVGYLRGIPLVENLVPNLFSLAGITFVSTLTLVPAVFLVMQNAFRNLDPSLEEASLTSGAGNLRTVWRVSLPSVRNAIIAAFLLATMVAIGEYSVPLILGTPARLDFLSVSTIRLVTATYPPRYVEGAAVGIIMLVILAAIWSFYVRVGRTGRFAKVGGKGKRQKTFELGGWRWLIRSLMVVYLFCSSVLPLIALVIASLQPYWTPRIELSKLTLNNFRHVVESNDLTAALINSALFGLCCGFVATVAVFLLVAFSKTGHSASATLGLAVVKVPAMASHVVLGLAFLIAFYGPPFNLANTVFLLGLCYITLYLPYASIVGEAAMSQVGSELVEASEVSGASTPKTQARILLPLTAPGLLAGWALMFAMIAHETSASRILASVGVPVAGFEILRAYEVGSYGQLAAINVILVTGVCIVVPTFLWVSRLIKRF